MADRIEFELVSPQRLLKSEPVEMVVVPATEGDIGVLPGHAPLIATVRPGVIDIHEGGRVRERIFVAGGFCEVTPDRCTMLAEEAQLVDEIDLDEAQTRLGEARTALEAAEADTRPALDAAFKIAQARVAAAGVTSAH